MDITDTLMLASRDRENQGPWEAEYSYGGEAELHQHFNKCHKNPGHKNFIPVDKFTINDLPEGNRDQDLMDYIRVDSDLTVRVTVEYVSDRRPATVPGSDMPYPVYDYRGQKKMTVGSGWVHSVQIFCDNKGFTCECEDCKKSSVSKTNFAIINITTATHVVFDDLEGAHTTCHLFFDSGSTPYNCSGVVTLKGMYSRCSEIDNDWCYLKHFTHDLDLARRLEQRVKLRDKLRDAFFTDLPLVDVYKRRLTSVEKKPLLFLVSHPHGCRKHISIGHCTGVVNSNPKVVSFLYTTASCPGSSGAHICIPYEPPNKTVDGICYNYSGSHCGSYDEQSVTNYCQVKREYKKKKSNLTVKTLAQETGSWENNFHCTDKEDLRKRHDNCQKNPGHQNFFPADQFSQDNLPPCYRADEMFNLIRVLSDLTVRLSVSYVSEGRPETVPGTDIPYPWYNHRGSKQLRMGSGGIRRVTIISEHCHCKECQISPTPETEFAYIYIESSAHFVHDQMEAEHTTCHLFFDSGETPALCSNVVTLTDMEYYYPKEGSGLFSLRYMTHNMDLARKLVRKVDKSNECFCLLKEVFWNMDYGDEQKQEIPLFVVVSHPHGCAKQIGIDYCNNYNTDTNKNNCPFAHISCEGSGGASVIVLGKTLYCPCCQVH
ncbi:unnamed protein product [Candidula unifasciata]|uniref:Uncharacterized protein n=1 Tax=Candidula unifasciata TaxID=100452 RepID=A0A8S3ZYB2_9EUPU|nr:unnamed protein product [Candidula unifasciata]